MGVGRAQYPGATKFVAKRTDIEGYFAVGATGAVGDISCRGVESITRNAAGKYTVVLKDVYSNLVGWDVKFLHATASTVGGVELLSEAVATVGTQNVVIQCRNYSGTGADPASGSRMYITLKLNNTNLPIA